MRIVWVVAVRRGDGRQGNGRKRTRKIAKNLMNWSRAFEGLRMHVMLWLQSSKHDYSFRNDLDGPNTDETSRQTDIE